MVLHLISGGWTGFVKFQIPNSKIQIPRSKFQIPKSEIRIPKSLLHFLTWKPPA
jgi:hypothetical protein